MKRIASLLVSAAILALVWSKVDARAIGPVLAHCDRAWMGAALAMVVPITACTACRLARLAPVRGALGFTEAVRLILIASVLNLVMPSKMGDIAKAWFVGERAHIDRPLAVALSVFEKACDLLSLLLWCLFGLAWMVATDAPARAVFAVGPAVPAHAPLLFWCVTAAIASAFGIGVVLLGSRRVAAACFGIARNTLPARPRSIVEPFANAWSLMQANAAHQPLRLLEVAIASLGIWFLHLLQVWMFIRALGTGVPFLATAALAPLALLAGLLPLTFAGIGTRDAALVVLFRTWMGAPAAAALGLLCTVRYLLPAIAGAPVAGAAIRRLRWLRTRNSEAGVAAD